MPDQDDHFARIQYRAVSELTFRQSTTTNLHMLHEVLPAGTAIRAYQQTIRVERDSVMVFADDAPQLNWAHPCRYLLFDPRSAQMHTEVHAQFPPYLIEQPDTYQAFHQPVILATGPQFKIPKPPLVCPIKFPLGERYAVLYSGASYNRHTNDLEFLYRTLRDLYGFKDSNIYCLNYDGTHAYNTFGGPLGTTWPGDGSPYRMPIKGKGTKSDLDAVFDDLKKRLKSDDLLLVHTNNHGGNDGPGLSYLVTYSGPAYYAADFAAKLGTLPKYDTLMVMMEQCHSGGFNAPILAHSTATKTTVSSACIEANSSIGDSEFDPFARDWIAAMAGHTPTGGALASNPDTDGNGRIYAEEAHAYADSVHDPSDTPVYSESSEPAGDTHLGQRYMWVWWWCPLLVKELERHYLRLPVPEFYEIVHDVLEPRLSGIEDEITEATRVIHKRAEADVQQLVAAAFKARS